nr:uncharacterized protein LOC113816107 [Penaeus vannamei]
MDEYLLSTKRTFRWSEDCQQAFNNLKYLLCTAPVLRAPDIGKPFVIHVDASDSGVGAVLLQKNKSEVLHPGGKSSIIKKSKMHCTNMPVTREKLIEEQYKDPELQTFYDRLTDTSNIDNFSTCYYLQSGVLMRKYKPYNISADDTSKIVHQIVIPKPFELMY